MVAIGGIDAGNAGQVLRAGADALAVIGGLFARPDPAAARASWPRLAAGPAAEIKPPALGAAVGGGKAQPGAGRELPAIKALLTSPGLMMPCSTL